MFVKKKKLTSISSEYTNIPIQRTTLGVRVPIEREKKICLLYTEDIKIYMRAAHSQLSPSYYYFLFAPKGTDNNAYTGVLSIIPCAAMAHTHTTNTAKDALQHTHTHIRARRQTVKSVDIIIHLNCGAGVGFLGNAHSCPKFRYRLFFFLSPFLV
jgi:hypothetical protein